MKRVIPTLLLAVLCLSMAPRASAQTNQLVSLAGQVVASDGLPIPQATVALRRAPGAATDTARPAVSGKDGHFQFDGLEPGSYEVTVSAPGYRPETRRSVRNSFGAIVMRRWAEVGVTLDRASLDRLPTSRDPWAAMTLTPNIVMSDGVNIAGADSGQQMSAASRAADGVKSIIWRLDGAPLTDLTALGSSAAYYNFGALDAITVTTAGLGASEGASGPLISLKSSIETKRFSGQAYGWASIRALQSSNIDAGAFADGAGAGVPLQSYYESGGSAGGPIVKGRLWWWAGGSNVSITRSTLNFYRLTPECSALPSSFDALDAIGDCLFPDRTRLTNGDVSATFRFGGSQTLRLDAGMHDKSRNSRSANALTAPEAAVRQHGASPRYVLRHRWTAGSRFLGETTASYRNSGFNLDFVTPELADVQVFRDLATGATSRSLLFASNNIRPSSAVATTLSAALTSWSSLKLGAGYRRDESSEYTTSGGQVLARYSGGASHSAVLYRDSLAFTRDEITHAFIESASAWKRVALTIGARVDHQDDQAPPASVPAHKLVPTFLVAASFDGGDPTVDFTDIAPRISASVDVFGNGRTVLSGAFGVYFGQTMGRLALAESLTAGTAALIYSWNDANRDRVFQLSEAVGLPTVLGNGFNFTTGLFAPPLPERLVPTFQNNRSREWVGRIDQELIPGWSAGAGFIARTYDRFRADNRLGDATSFYVPRAYTDPVSGLSSTYYEYAFGSRSSDTVITNAAGRSVDYRGLELTTAARLAGRGSLNASFVRQSSTARWPAGSYIDPTDIANLDGRPSDVSLPRYVFRASGTLDLPYGFGAGLVLSSREGFIRNVVFDGPSSRRGITSSVTTLMAGPLGAERYPSVTVLDLQADKDLTITRSVRLRLSAVAFNALNAGTVLTRESNRSKPNFDSIVTMLGPRVFRFGATLTF